MSQYINGLFKSDILGSWTRTQHICSAKCPICGRKALIIRNLQNKLSSLKCNCGLLADSDSAPDGTLIGGVISTKNYKIFIPCSPAGRWKRNYVQTFDAILNLVIQWEKEHIRQDVIEQYDGGFDRWLEPRD